MAELRLVGVSEDGQHLVLADDSGDQHTVAIDERMRAAVNGHLSRLGQLTMALESRISPREIQDRVRAGESAEHVAFSAGVPLERVLRFVGPVLREREHVADQARHARLAGTSGPTSLLIDVVNRAASRQGVSPDDVTWDSARREDHSWVVNVSWPDGGTATWALDLLRHQATPIDPTARRISGINDEPTVFRSDVDADLDADAATRHGADADASDERIDLEAADLENADLDTVPLELDHNVRPFVRRLSFDDGPAPHDQPADDAAPTSDPEASEQHDASGPAAPANRRNRHRRARVPKWDDIMFGPKSKD